MVQLTLKKNARVRGAVLLCSGKSIYNLWLALLISGFALVIQPIRGCVVLLHLFKEICTQVDLHSSNPMLFRGQLYMQCPRICTLHFYLLIYGISSSEAARD